MLNLALLDDRQEQRETLLRLFKAKLPSPWKCKEVPLLPTLKLYPKWFATNEVSVLLIDEKLNEQEGGGKALIPYTGHQVISFLRSTLPTLPVFIVTSHKIDPDLEEHRGEAEDILNRRELTDNINIYVSRFVRAGKGFADRYEKDLAELTTLSQKVALGKAKKEDITKLESLQAPLHLPMSEETNSPRGELLAQLEEKLKEVEKLAVKVKKQTAK